MSTKIYQPEIKVEKVSIENFRGFANLELEFQPDVTVLIGENGSGKTAILDCLASLLVVFQEHMQKNKFDLKKLLALSDIKQGKFGTNNVIKLQINKLPISYQISLNIQNSKQFYDFNVKLSPETRNSIQISKSIQFQQNAPSDISYIRDIINPLGSRYNNAVNLVLFVYYPTGNAPINTIDFKNASDNFATNIFTAYEGALDKTSFDFINFFNWYKWQENIERQIGTNKVLDTVREAIYNILSDKQHQFNKLSINWLNNPNGEMLICKDEIPLNINQLSSGEKTLLALVADLARRLAIANPHRENPLEGNGVVLIDEVDLHLHPRWQRALIPQLQKTFPNCQLIVTTHSTLVLSNISHKNVIVLEDFQAVKITPNTYGRDNNSILYELMGVKQRPDEMQQRLDKVYELIDDEKLPEAKELQTKLLEILGPNDPDIVYLNSLFNFIEGE